MNKSIIPNLFTSANLAFGVLGITFSATGNTFYAAVSYTHLLHIAIFYLISSD